MTLDPERAYPHIKRQYPDAVLFFQVGQVADELGRTWTVLEADAQLIATLAGLPPTNLITMGEGTARKHMDTLIRSGRKIAICEATGG